MSLTAIPKYDSERVSTAGDHAVVVGGSMAGLVSARVLADAFESVTVLERDSLHDDREPRRGVPQGRHVHALQTAGREVLETLFPGYQQDLAAAGAEVIDVATDFSFYDEGGFVADGDDRQPMYCGTRPLFEVVTRRHLTARDDVALRDNCQFTGYRTDDRDTTVTGVTLRNEQARSERLTADVVVDATGRTSRTPDWLEAHGYSVPPLEEVHVDLAYSTAFLCRPPDDRRAFHVMPSPPRKRGVVVLPVEGDRWVVTLFGVHGDHPPSTIDGLRDFAAELPAEPVQRLLDTHEPASTEVAQYPVPSSRRRRYWDLERFPDGLVVAGDAVASFNPVYGQGMSVAALQALQLHHTLAETGAEDIGVQFFDRVEPVIEDAWNVAVGTDFRFEETEGPKPTGTDLLNRYLSRLTRKAHRDATLADAYARVISLERRPTSLLRPTVAWRVLKPSPL
ncbi:FAD-dependent oxidoreductase [Salinirussus salinus]|uniref:FAD-dependent oxidoreductase n=1 Tax=Salinirussus salinus TaxID=1198300 RepID=UPI00135833AB|nr:FAD-dependent monooxygenase [Salinirussus salinus]